MAEGPMAEVPMAEVPESHSEGGSDGKPIGPRPVLVVVSDPGHHERTETAALMVAILRPMATEVAVSADLRPRLAAGVAGLLEAGANGVLLVGSAMIALARADQGTDAERKRRHLASAEVIVRLSPGTGSPRARIEAGKETPLGTRVAETLAGADLTAAVR